MKKSYKHCGHLCYKHIGLRFTTYEYLPPLLTLKSKSYVVKTLNDSAFIGKSLDQLTSNGKTKTK